MGERTRRSFVKVAGASTLGVLGSHPTVAAESSETSAVEIGIEDQLQTFYANGEYDKAIELLESSDVSATTRTETFVTQPSDTDGDLSGEHWFDEGDSDITHAGFLWKKAEKHSYLENNVYQFDVS